MPSTSAARTDRTTVRVVIADDSAVMLDTLAMVMGACAAIDVVATAPDAASLFRAVRETRPDVVLLDLRFGGTWGFDLVPGLRVEPSAPQVIVLSAMADERTQGEATRSGAFCQLSKGCPLDDLRWAVVQAARAGSRLTGNRCGRQRGAP